MSEVTDLYDYDRLRRRDRATMVVARAQRPTLVLGGNQPLDVLATRTRDDLDVRRRRGGGGLVLLTPSDVWLDWWLPSNDVRWRADIRQAALLVGNWWAAALRDRVGGEVTVHGGALEGAASHRLVCFAGRGPGEVFVDGRKAVGLTQWRVREGSFLSTVLPGHPSLDLLTYLRDVPEGLAASLEHHTLASLAITSTATLIDDVARRGGDWFVESNTLSLL